MQKLGNILKEARLAREMTLEELSLKCGYSKALISRIENNSVSPSITSLSEISLALDLKLYDIFASFDDTEPVIVRKTERRKFTQSNGMRDVEYLANGLSQRKMQPLLVSLNKGSSRANGCSTHNGEEFLHVFQGTIEVSIGSGKFILSPGDSIHFKSTIPHGYRGIGRGKAVTLKVTYPPYY